LILVLALAALITLAVRQRRLEHRLEALRGMAGLEALRLPGDLFDNESRIMPEPQSFDLIQNGLAVSFDSVVKTPGVTRLVGNIINMNSTDVTNLTLVFLTDTAGIGCALLYPGERFRQCQMFIGREEVPIGDVPAAGSSPYSATLGTPGDTSTHYKWKVIIKEFGTRYAGSSRRR
jgi:hypothetical protein